MSTPSEVKIRLDPALKKQFELRCREAGTTMSAEINYMIQAATEQPDYMKPELDEVAAPGGCEVIEIEDDPVFELLTGKIDELRELVIKGQADRPQNWFEQWFKLRVAPEFAALAKQQDSQTQFRAATGTSLAALQISIAQVEHNTRVIQPRFYQDYKIWTAAAGGALALVLLLALLPGETAPSRFIARKIIGGKNDVHAAGVMAGGNSFAGQLIFETSALMKTEPFAIAYARCIEKAKNAKKVTRCTLTFPALVR